MSARSAASLALAATLATACAHPAATGASAVPPAPSSAPPSLAIPTCTPEPPAPRPTDGAHRYRQLARGKFFLCGLREDGHAACWPPLEDAGRPVATPDDEFTQITAGDFFACGLRRDGTARCWGDDNGGATRAPAGTFRRIEGGEMGILALRSDGTLAAWGAGEAPDSVGTGGRSPTRNELSARYVDLAAGAAHRCARTDAGAVACWGGNPGPGESIELPPGVYRAVAASLRGTCGLRADGTVGCSKGSEPPDASTRFVEIGGGRYGDFCGVRSDGGVSCWGGGHDEAGKPYPVFSPRLRPGERASGLVTGGSVCALVDGTPRCWGSNAPLVPFVDARAVDLRDRRCVLGRDCRLRCDDDRDMPEAPLTDADVERFEQQAIEWQGQVVAISTGAERGSNGCRLRAKGTLACGDRQWEGTFAAFSDGGGAICGLATDGHLVCRQGSSEGDGGGDGDAGGGLGPAPAGRFVDVSVADRLEVADDGRPHACAVRDDGAVLCWGQDTGGDTRPPPGPFARVSTGSGYSCALRKDGTAACWGQGPPAPAGRFRALSVGARQACALDAADGHAVCWGEDPSGGRAKTPAGPFRAITATGRERCGVRPNGDVPCWGRTILDE